MRTNIEIDDELMATALALTGLRTKRAVVDAALRALIDRHNRRQLKEAFGRYRSGKAIWTSSATGTETSRDDGGRQLGVDRSPERPGDPADVTTGQFLDDEDLPIIVGDIIMYEVLCGFCVARAALEVKAMLGRRLLVSMLGFDLVYRCVGNYHALRGKGVTIKAADLFIGSYCIESGVQILTSDSDFLAMRDHLGLRLVA